MKIPKATKQKKSNISENPHNLLIEGVSLPGLNIWQKPYN